MTARPQEETLSILLIGRWEGIGHKLAELAGEFPEEKFDYRPVEGVRTFGETLRHVVFWNRYVADTLRGAKADDSANEVAAAEYPTKSRIVEALSQSSREVAAALRESSFDRKTTELVIPFIEHNCEHYGQLAVYSRLMGIVPSASRLAATMT